MSFNKRFNVAPVCYSKPLDSVKNWNDHFFWVDSVAFSIFVSLNKSKTFSKDPPPKLSQYDTQTYDFLRTHTDPFRKFPEPFLYWVGISHYYRLDENCYLTFWDSTEGGYTLLYIPDLIVLRLYLIILFYYVAEIDLFSFIRHSDPTKVLIGERNVTNGEVKLLTMTEGRIVPLVPPASAASGVSMIVLINCLTMGTMLSRSILPEEMMMFWQRLLPRMFQRLLLKKPRSLNGRGKRPEMLVFPLFLPKKLREDYHAATSNIGEKSLATIRSLIFEGSSVSSEVAEPRDDGPTDSVSGLNFWTRPPSMRYVVSSDDSHHSGSRSEVNSFARSPVADAPVLTVAVTTTIYADVFVVSVSKDRVMSKNLENFGDSAYAGGANVNVTSSLKLNEPATSSDFFLCFTRS
ncbi:hypothetical protein Tco_1013716 [Tanacetum coccineum]